MVNRKVGKKRKLERNHWFKLRELERTVGSFIGQKQTAKERDDEN